MLARLHAIYRHAHFACFVARSPGHDHNLRNGGRAQRSFGCYCQGTKGGFHGFRGRESLSRGPAFP